MGRGKHTPSTGPPPQILKRGYANALYSVCAPRGVSCTVSTVRFLVDFAFITNCLDVVFVYNVPTDLWMTLNSGFR